METTLPLIMLFTIAMTLILKDISVSKINAIADFFRKILSLLTKNEK